MLSDVQKRRPQVSLFVASARQLLRYACPMGAHASVCLEHACPCAACVACDREQTEKAELCRGISCIITERFSERLDEF